MYDLTSAIKSIQDAIKVSDAASEESKALLIRLCDLSDGLAMDVVFAAGHNKEDTLEQAISYAAHDIKIDFPEGIYLHGGCNKELGYYAAFHEVSGKNPCVIPDTAIIVRLSDDDSLVLTTGTYSDLKEQHAAPGAEGPA